MSRFIVEDCLQVVRNRFSLAMLAGYRARKISEGSEVKVNRAHDREAVIALREIAEGHYTHEVLEDSFIKSLQKSSQAEDYVDDEAYDNTKQAAVTSINQFSKSQEAEDEFISVEDYDFEDDTSADD